MTKLKNFAKIGLTCLVLLSILLTVCFAADDGGKKEPAPSWKNGVPGEVFADGVLSVAENDNYALAIKRETIEQDGAKSIIHSVEITVKATGTVYSSAVPLDYYGTEETSKVLRDGLAKLISVSTTDFGSRNEVLHSSAVGTVFHYQTIENGVRVYIHFPTRDIGVTLDFTIDEDGLCVKVPKNGLVEDGKYGILSLDILPLFNAIRSGDDGYMLFPDGSGSIYEIPEKATSQKFTTVDVYSPADMNLQTLEDNRQQGVKNVMLPVFGSKKGNEAVLGVITEGDAYAQLNLAPGGHMYKQLNRIYPTFRYRKSFAYQTTNDTEAYEIEAESRVGDVAVRYFFLDGEEANYSGMAVTYRNWLLKNGQLKATTVEQPIVHMTFLGGVLADSLLGDSLKAFSSFDEIGEKMETQFTNGRNRLLLSIAGWQKSGYGVYPAHTPVSSALGGKNSLTDLANLLKTKNVSLLLNDNFLQANSYGTRSDSQIIYDYLHLPITDKDNENYLLNPLATQKQLDKVNKLCLQSGTAVLYEKYGSLLYEDYKDRRNLTRSEMIDALVATLKSAKESQGLAAAGGGNAYLLGTADWLSDIPMDNSGYLIFDYSVPFYQMVVHGSIPYAPTLPGNMSTDFTREKLQWMETGSTPYFLLCTRSDSDLKYTIFAEPFSLQYDNWEETVNTVYDEFAMLSDYCNGAIRRHEIINDNVRRVTYENGCVLLINYDSESTVFEGQNITAQGYVLLNEKGETVCRG